MFPIHIFAGDIPAPCAATERQCNRHAIIKIAAISVAMGLIDHDTAGLNPYTQFNDVVFAGCMDTAGMSVSIYRSDSLPSF